MPEGVGPDCNLCGATTDGGNGREWVGTARDPDGDGFFRHAVVCSDCWHQRVLPWLRWLFRHGPENHNLNAPPGGTPRDAADVDAPGGPETGVTFTTGGTRHAAEEVRSGAPYGGRGYCVAHCGVRGFYAPDPSTPTLAGDDDACERCLEAAPAWVGGGL